MSEKPAFNSVMLKLSGEAFQGKRAFGIDFEMLARFADEITSVVKLGVKLSVVVGAGNFFRGIHASEQGIDRVVADYMGMLATILNCVALQDVLEKKGFPTRVLSSIEVPQICEPYIRRRAVRHLEKGRIVVFAAGTGNPYFSTDTAAALRAVEIGAEVIFKATKVDGVYDCDPMTHPEAKKYDRLTHTEVIQKNLQVMDVTAISLCRDNNLKLVVFNLLEAGNIKRALMGEEIGTRVVPEDCPST